MSKILPAILVVILLNLAATSLSAASITMTNSDVTERSFNTKGNWNDSVAPQPGNSYFTANFTVRGPAQLSGNSTNYVFQGDSLSVDSGGSLSFKTTNGVTVNDLILNGGSFVHALSGVNPDILPFFGNVSLAPATTSTISLTGGGTRLINFLAPFSGSGDLRVVGAASSVVFLSASNNFGGGTLTHTLGTLTLNDLNALNGLSGLVITNSASAQVKAAVDGTFPSLPTYIYVAGSGFTPPGALVFTGTNGATWPGALISLNDVATVGASSSTDVTNTLTGPLGGANNLTLRGHAPSGSVEEKYLLTANSTNTGGLIILSTNSANVTVQLNAGANTLSPLSSVTLRAASGLTNTLDLNGNDQQVAGLASTGAGVNQVISSSGGAITLTISNTADFTFAGNLAPNGEAVTVLKQGSGSQVFSGNVTIAGNTTISGGSTRVGTGGVYGTGSNTLTVQSGTTLAGQGTILDTVVQQAGSTNSPGNVGIASPGTLTVSNLTLNGGTLRVDLNAANNATGGGVNDLIDAKGVINASGTIYVTPIFTGGSPTVGTTYTLITSTNSPWATGDASNFAVTPGTPIVVSFDTTTTPGNLLMTIQAGSIDPLVWLGTNGNNWDITTTNWLNSNTSLPDKFTSLNPLTFDDTSTNGNVNLVGSLTPGNVTFNNASLNYVLSGSGEIAGLNGVTLSGSGSVTIANDNSYSGGTTVNAGTLQLGNGGTTGSVAGAITDNGVLAFNYSSTVTNANTISGAGSLVKLNANTLILTGANTYSSGTVVSNGTLQVGNGGAAGSIQGDVVNQGILAVNRSGSLTLGGVISGPGSFQKSGSGTAILTADNIFTGGATVNSGTLQLGNNAFTGSVVGNITNNGTLTFNRVDDLVYTNIIVGTGSVLKAGSGSLTFTANQTFTGGLKIDAGTLVLTNVNNQTTNTLGASGTLVVGNSGALGSGGLNTEISTSTATLALSNNVTILAGKPVTFYARNNTSVAFQNLSGSNTIATSISMNSGGNEYHVQSDSGTLAVGGFSSIVNGKFLHLQGNGDGLVYGPVTGNGGLTIDGPGTWVLTGANSYDATVINGGLLQIGNGGSGGTLGSGSVTIGSALVLNRAGSYTAANYLTGAGSLTNAGSGIVTLSNPTNDYSGATVVSGGTLRVNGGLLNSSVSVASGATLGGTGKIYSPVTLDAGSTLAPATASIGTLTVSNDLTFAGNLYFKLNKSLVQSNDVVIASGVLTNGGTGTLTLTNLGAGLVAGDSFQLFSQPVLNGDAITIPVLGGVTWTNRLAQDGSVVVLSAPALVNTNSPVLTNLVSGGTLTLSWPADHLGWRLETQTNQLSAGLGTNWVTWPGSTNVTTVNLPISATEPTVFYRLVYP